MDGARQADPPLDLTSDTIVLASCSRGVLPRASEAAASKDPKFLELVALGDERRDAGAWHEAEEAYRAALALYPYQAGYWVQRGHMLKEQGRFGAAEIAYRTAVALGEQGVIEHLRFVMERQGANEARHPIRLPRPGTAPEQAPTQPDIVLLARLLWHSDDVSEENMLALLRESATLDELFAAMVTDNRFTRANINWLSYMHDEDLVLDREA